MQITIHRALAELKLIDKKIDKAMADLRAVGIIKNGSSIVQNTNLSSKEFETKANSLITSILDLSNRYLEIKSKIVLSNASTKIKIGDKEYTVAEAIERKNCNYFARLEEKLVTQKSLYQDKLERLQEEMEEQLNRQLESMGVSDKASTNGFLDFIDAYRAKNGYNLITPYKFDKLLDNLSNNTMEFDTEVDAVLSESNSTTFIEIDD